ncbi:MAG: hypothetical protein IPF95_02185 [Flavobacteriales bacterium]|nr:hypothetical protein [Flavobacteriales bacterium]MBK6944746.1 hypothetical protein [Flavobacteriales bacterium]MBK7295748.1 hypothetical protein [Flavobacteriales bacterium]HQV50806.1 hypothetical protein [Flavobacteriales bacterium]
MTAHRPTSCEPDRSLIAAQVWISGRVLQNSDPHSTESSELIRYEVLIPENEFIRYDTCVNA